VRPLEVLLLASLAFSGIALCVAPDRRPRWLRNLPALPISLALLHLFINHGRWQLFGAYGVAAVMSIVAVAQMRTRDGVPPDRPWRRRIGGVSVLLVTGVASLLAWLVPVFPLPAPTGPLKVGSRWLVLTDGAREEALTPEPGDRRQVVVRVWYPADSVAGDTDSYMEEPVARAIASALSLPAIVFSHLSLVSTHSYRTAWLPSAPARFPLILFSHGYAVGTESQDTVQMQELASHGFVVASIDHPYEAGAILMPGARLLRTRLPFNPLSDTAAVRRTTEAIARLQLATDTAAIAAEVQQLYATSDALQTYAGPRPRASTSTV
jgi:predicted dienelactone hydrolase